MDKIKGTLLTILVIVIFIIVPVSLFTNLITAIGDAIKWVVFIDNAETGLPMVAEYITKAIVEGIVLIIAGLLGVKEKNPFVAIATIVFGFAICVVCYFIAQYIIWILISFVLVLFAVVIYYIVKNNKKEKKLIEPEKE